MHLLNVENGGKKNTANTRYVNGLRPYANRIAANRLESNSSRSLTARSAHGPVCVD
jgi:hypothetical protein